MCRVELQFPIEVDGKSISSVTIRWPKGKAMPAFRRHLNDLLKCNPAVVPDASAFKSMVSAIAALAGLSEKEAGDLDIIDINAIAAAAFMEFGSWPGRGAPAMARRH